MLKSRFAGLVAKIHAPGRKAGTYEAIVIFLLLLLPFGHHVPFVWALLVSVSLLFIFFEILRVPTEARPRAAPRSILLALLLLFTFLTLVFWFVALSPFTGW